MKKFNFVLALILMFCLTTSCSEGSGKYDVVLKNKAIIAEIDRIYDGGVRSNSIM
jgi:hypothetical protein